MATDPRLLLSQLCTLWEVCAVLWLFLELFALLRQFVEVSGLVSNLPVDRTRHERVCKYQGKSNNKCCREDGSGNSISSSSSDHCVCNVCSGAVVQWCSCAWTKEAVRVEEKKNSANEKMRK